MKNKLFKGLAVGLVTTTMMITSLAGPATAAQSSEMTEALVKNWLAEQQLDGQRRAWLLEKLTNNTGPQRHTNGEFTRDVERWRLLVTVYFPAERVDWALRIIACESTGDPDAKNPRSSASGLFQHLGSLWEERAVAAGWPGADIFDPLANIAVAAWLLDNGGPSHWVCKA